MFLLGFLEKTRGQSPSFFNSKSQGYPTYVSLTILENRPDLDRTDGQGRAIQCSRRAVLPVDRLLADDLLHPVET